jgi:hypothetical protein
MTLIEDIFLTRELFDIFDYDDDIEYLNKITSDETSSGFKDIASLLSSLGTKVRANHYWTRRGHQSKSTTTPEYGWEYYYYNYAPMYRGDGIGLGRRKRSVLRRMKRDGIRKVQDAEVILSEKNQTSQLPRPMLDYRLKKGL